MDALIRKYDRKLVRHGLCDEGSPLIAGLDAGIVWNREGDEKKVLEQLIGDLNITCILFSKPAGPYDKIIDYVSRSASAEGGDIYPDDCETRTFLHDIPVARDFTYDSIIYKLKKRKAVVVPGHGIITLGSVSPEQAFIIFSSVCFSCYVKIMVDFYYSLRKNLPVSDELGQIIREAMGTYAARLTGNEFLTPRMAGPFKKQDDINGAIAEAGSLVIKSGMVDSFFGNISYKSGDAIYISQTGSSLDELMGNIDRCPVDNRRCNAITASSEFSAHRGIYERRDSMSILHGHPKFSVIMSMICDDYDCPDRGKCHIACRSTRFIHDIPVVPGEVGTGPRGLCNTLPRAFTGRGAIVYGHGLFTAGKIDFIDAFRNCIDIEKLCFQDYASGIGVKK